MPYSSAVLVLLGIVRGFVLGFVVLGDVVVSVVLVACYKALLSVPCGMLLIDSALLNIFLFSAVKYRAAEFLSVIELLVTVLLGTG